MGIPTVETEEHKRDAASLAELAAKQKAEQEEAKWDLSKSGFLSCEIATNQRFSIHGASSNIHPDANICYNGKTSSISYQ